MLACGSALATQRNKTGCGGLPELYLKTRKQAARVEEIEHSILTESIPGEDKNQNNEKIWLLMCNIVAGTNTYVSKHNCES